MNFKDMWKEQKKFNKIFIPNLDSLTEEERNQFTKDYAMSIMGEVGELMKQINWKLHRREIKEYNKDNIVEEIVDLFKYTMSLAVLWCDNSDEFLEENYKKSVINQQRYVQEFISTYKDCCVIDIDGVLAQYRKGFIEFINKETGNSFKEEDTERYDFWIDLKINAKDWRVLKEKFRKTGVKRQLETYRGASTLTKCLKAWGYSIVIVTARPVRKYKRVARDTLFWLRDKNIQFDSLVFTENKLEGLIDMKIPFENIKFAIEDDLGNAKRFASCGVLTYLIDQSYNQCENLDTNICRMKNLSKITGELQYINNLI